MNEIMDKIMLEFPLCCLSFPDNPIEHIISYCIVEHAKKVETLIKQRIDEKEFNLEKLPSDFNRRSREHQKIILAADELGITVGNIWNTKTKHEKLADYISTFQLKYGPDSYCRVGKKLCFETRDKKFPYRQFAMLCGIQSILGKQQKFKRITKDRIRYAMLGYKSKTVALTEMDKTERLLTDRQLGITIELLNSKRLITKFTYANRQTFFTTHLNKIKDSDEATKTLGEWVMNLKVYWAKKKAHLVDREMTEKIKSKLKLIKFPVQKVG
jgi:hypothetical protein